MSSKDQKTGRTKRTGADLAAVSPVGGGAKAANSMRLSTGCRTDLPDPAFGGEREIELDCVAGAPADRAGAGRGRRSSSTTVIVVTDRKVLDQQIRDTIKQYAQVGSVVGHASETSGGPARRCCGTGKRIVITTVQKFPFILDAIGERSPGAPVRDHDRRGALEPGRTDIGGGFNGAEREWRARWTTTRRRKTRSTG